MTTDSTDLPVFPTTAPDVFSDPTGTAALFGPVLDRLAELVVVDDAALHGPTPCDDFSVADLRRHVLAWLQFFAAALTDPSGSEPRIDPETWTLSEGDDPADIVRAAATDIADAAHRGVADDLVVMSQSRMAGTGVLGMALGEYLVHGWDLATATGRPYPHDDAAAEPALAFLRNMVAPEYRGPDTGFFDAEVAAPADATPFVQLLCFAGREPGWAPSASN